MLKMFYLEHMQLQRFRNYYCQTSATTAKMKTSNGPTRMKEVKAV